jgi:hypothetical protein
MEATTSYIPMDRRQALAANIQPWLLPPVDRHLRNGQDQFLAEIRPAVVLFLNV